MSRPVKGLLLAVIQVAIVLAVAGKYYADRSSLPRVWARAVPYDPNLPIRGRYVSLRVEVETTLEKGNMRAVELSVRDGKLIATATDTDGLWVNRLPNGRIVLVKRVAFFIPEQVADPSRRAPGEELWVEVSVPKKGPPRPLRLGVKRDGVLTPLALD